MPTLTADFECTTSNTGNPFDSTNKAVCLAYKHDDGPAECDFLPEKGPDPSTYDLVIFFNAKFDLHWYRRIGEQLPKRVWCCQLAEYILSGQRLAYPSLENTSVSYNLGHKLDVIKLEYWDRGINTDQIPREVLADYAKQDVELTYKVYLKQLERFKEKPKLFQLFKLGCQDLLILEEMEWNGLPFNEELCNQRSQEVQEELSKHLETLCNVYPDVPINFNSPEQLSAFLYGGDIKSEVVEIVGVYGPKAQKAGQPKTRKREVIQQLPRLVEPLPKSEMAKPGVFATDEGTLRKLKGPAAKKYVGLLLELARLDKLDSTYYRGLVNLNKDMNWPAGKLHGQFNQVVARTGRLSSSKPNLQNFASECQDIFPSEYND